MQGIIDWLNRVNEAVSLFVWGPPMLALFLGAGAYFTILTRGLQFRRLGDILLSPFRWDTEKGGGISAFAAVSGALAGTLGIGNIVGVAGALMLGGPGVVFWMVASALLCMILKYAETVLAMCYRRQNANGETIGGPMYYMRDGLNFRLMPKIFCLFCIATALFGAGNITQIGTISHAVEETFDISGLWVSLSCAGIILLITGGSVRRLGRVFTLLTPRMSIFFLAATLGVLALHAKAIPHAVGLILQGALAPEAAAGGAGAYLFLSAMKYGVARGVFSNEAGLGSSPIIHAASQNTPSRQGFCGAFEVFFDTVVMAGLTALAILSAGVPLEAASPTSLCVQAYASVFGAHSGEALTIMLVVFAVSSVPCWYFYGEKCTEYLVTGHRAIKGYRVLFFLLMAVCPLIRLDGMWQLADTLNGLMAVPNLIAVIMLSREVAAVTVGDDAQSALQKRRSPSMPR